MTVRQNAMSKNQITFLIVIALFIGLIAACVMIVAVRKTTFSRTDSNKSIQTNPSPSKSMPPTIQTGTGKIGIYEYFYRREGNNAVVGFPKKFLPRDDTILTIAVKDVLKNVFDETEVNPPELVDKFIMFRGKKGVYAVFIVKQDTGEIHSLVITSN